MSIQTPMIDNRVLWSTIRRLSLAFYFFGCLPAQVMAIEPLDGPKIGQAWYLEPKSSDDANLQIKKSKFLNADIPIPIPLFIAMPFTSVSYEDKIQGTDPHFLSDQRIGIGLLHHPAEGDPSWRLDWTRVGSSASRGLSWLKFSANLGKPFPWLKPRPSDQLIAWVALNAVDQPRENLLWIPELGWKRTGADGLSLELVAPRYVFLGYRGPKYGLLVGVEQTLKIWSTSDSGFENDHWSINRQSVLKLLARPNENITVSISGIRQLPDGNIKAGYGSTVAIQWTPNP